MNSKHELIINEIRKKYERKFKISSELRQWFENEILTLKQKQKITLEDLNELESKLENFKRLSHRTKSFDASIHENASPQIKSKNNSIISRELTNTSFKSDNYSVLLPNKPDKILGNTSPFVRHILKKTDLSKKDHNSRSLLLNQTTTDFNFPSIKNKQDQDTFQLIKEKKLDLARIKTEGDRIPIYPEKKTVYCGPINEDAYGEDIWKKIQDHQMQAYENERKKKTELMIQKKKEWLDSLREQTNQKKLKHLAEQEENIEIQSQMVQKDKEIYSDLLTRDLFHKEKIRKHDVVNIDIAYEREMKKRHERSQEKIEDMELMKKNVSVYKKELDDKKNVELEKKKIFKIWQDENIKIKSQRRMAEKENEIKIEKDSVKHLEQKMKEDELKVVKFYEDIRERSRKQNDPFGEKRFDNLRRYNFIEKVDYTAPSSFINSFEQRLENMRRKREKEQQMMKKILISQRNEKVQRDNNQQGLMHLQKDNWKEEQKIMEERDKIEKEVEKHKKIIQKNFLDNQMDLKPKFKNKFVERDLVLNAKLLKDVGFLPQNHSESFLY